MNRQPEFSEEEANLLGLNAPTEEEIEAEKSRAERIELRQALLANLMANELFREWLMEILTGFNTFGRTFAASPTGFPDTAATEFHLGMKAAGWFLWEQFDTIAPELASLMRREAGRAGPSAR